MTISTFAGKSRLALIAALAGLAFAAVASAQTALPPPAYSPNADARQDRIEELEGQLRDATAENERLQFELMQAQREVARLQGMMGELAAANQSLQVPAELPPDAAGEASAPNAPAQPQPRQTGTLGELPASALPGEAGPAYSRARELLVQGNYAEAEIAFGQFLEAHADAETAPDARYWYAFTLLARNNYQEAAANFVTYLQSYPNGPRAPDAQVRLGMALIGLEQTRQGCAAFASLPRRYPRAPQAVRDLAQREARAANCAA